MPQLDLGIFVHESLEATAYFVILYHMVTYILIPRIFFVLFVRRELFVYLNKSFKKFVIKFILL